MSSYNHIHSSWNTDRIGACIVNKPHKVRRTRKAYLYAQYRGREVSLFGSRGAVHFTLKFDSDVTSAIVKDGLLIVKTTDDCVRQYDVRNGVLVSETRPLSPVDAPVAILDHSACAIAA